MPNTPSIYEVHQDVALTNLSIKYNNDEFIADQVCPKIQVKKKSDIFYVFGKEHMKVKNDIRVPGTQAQEIYHSYATDNYSCEAHALKEKVPDEVKDNQDDPIDAEMDATELVTDSLMLNREKRVAALFTNPANYSTGMSSSPTTKWGTAGSTPRKTILETCLKAIHSKIFQKPNTIIIPFEVAVTLSWHADIIDIVKYTKDDLLLVQDGIVLPKNLWGLKVIVPGAGENTAAMGQEETLGYIWGDNVVIAYTNPGAGLKKITFAQTFQWKTREVSKWYDQPIKSTWIQCEEWNVEKFVCKDAGYLLYDVL